MPKEVLFVYKSKLSVILTLYFWQELDLNNPKSFRVFSKPMGAQSEDRLKQFQKKYREWEDPTGIHSIITTTDKILERWLVYRYEVL